MNGVAHHATTDRETFAVKLAGGEEIIRDLVRPAPTESRRVIGLEAADTTPTVRVNGIAMDGLTARTVRQPSGRMASASGIGTDDRIAKMDQRSSAWTALASGIATVSAWSPHERP